MITARPSGGSKPGDLDGLEYAVAYVREIENGNPKPIATLQRDLACGYHANRARDLVKRARAVGLLTSVARGRTGGDLTDKAKRLLAGLADPPHNAGESC